MDISQLFLIGVVIYALLTLVIFYIIHRTTRLNRY